MGIAERIREIFSEMGRDEYVAWIKEIQGQLCPTCLENQDFNPEAERDCTKSPKYVSAEDIYEGNCDEDVADHWIGALIDARGALKQIAALCNQSRDLVMRKPFYSEEFRGVFAQACKDAQELMGHGQTWEDLDPLSSGVEVSIGMAYKCADKRDLVYNEMVRLGNEA